MSKISETRKRYNSERKRIENQMRKMEKRCYFFNKQILPDIPKNVTEASIRRLQKITTNTLYEKSAYIIDEYGTFVTGLEGKQIEKELRKQAREKEKEKTLERLDYYTTIYDNFFHDMSRVDSSVFKSVTDIISRFEQQFGKERVAIGLESMPESFYTVLREHEYDSDSAPTDFAQRLLNYIPDLGQLEMEMLTEQIDQMGYYELPE